MPDPGEFAEFDVRNFRVGGVYEVAPRLGMLLIIAGHAEPVVSKADRAEAADAPSARSERFNKR